MADENQTYCSVDGVLFTKDLKTLLCYPEGKTETQYTIPNTTETIFNNAFDSALHFENVIIPDSVTKISESVFAYCTALKKW